VAMSTAGEGVEALHLNAQWCHVFYAQWTADLIWLPEIIISCSSPDSDLHGSPGCTGCPAGGPSGASLVVPVVPRWWSQWCPAGGPSGAPLVVPVVHQSSQLQPAEVPC
jgi:hypothetical protein